MKHLKLYFQDTFWVAPTQADKTEFPKFSLQLKNHRSGSKTMSGFCIVFILKGILMFRESKESMLFAEQKCKL